MTTPTTTAKRPLGAYSKQRAALALLAMPVLRRMGVTLSPALVERAAWGIEHGINPHRDYRLKGVRRG